MDETRPTRHGPDAESRATTDSSGIGDLPTVADGPAPRPRILVPALDLPNPPHPIPDTAGTEDRYIIQDELGRGGIASVHVAFDTDLRRHVALKRLLGDSPTALADLVREAQITAQIEHPNIPSVHGFGVDAQGKPYFAMTLVEGMTLSELLAQEGPLPPRRALRLFLQVCYAVAYAHSRGVVHRDIKPQNIILGRFGEVRLIDWGLAKVCAPRQEPAGEEASRSGEAPAPQRELQDATQAGVVKGTPGYMAPEQAEGRTDIDHRTDVYGLGALLYRMLSGRKPVEAESTVEAIVATKRGEVVPLGQVADVPVQLEAIVHKALALDREQRYQSVQDLISDVLAFLDGLPVKAAQETIVQAASRVYFSPLARWDFQFFHLDMMCGATGFLSLALGLVLAGILGTWLWPVAVASLLLGALMLVPVVRHVRRVASGREARDPTQAASIPTSTFSPAPTPASGRTQPPEDGARGSEPSRPRSDH